jgi:alpha-D-ribose 1-methylphosphonate 5-triphosphate synthase subunit PhnG
MCASCSQSSCVAAAATGVGLVTGLAGGTGTCAFLVGVGRITPEGPQPD